MRIGASLPASIIVLSLLVCSSRAQGPNYIGTFGGPGDGPGQLYFPRGIAADVLGNWYVSDTSHHRIQVFSSSGAYLRQWGTRGGGPGEFEGPRGIAVGPGPLVYVSDSGNNRIEVFTPTGQFVREWGSYGTGVDQMEAPRGVAADGTGSVYVAEGARVHKFSADGTSLGLWYANEQGPVGSTSGVAVDAAGFVFVSTSNSCIGAWKFTQDGQFIAAYCAGYAVGPGGIAVDAQGGVYVADPLRNRLLMFASTGEYLGPFGTAGTGPVEFSQPSDVAIDGAGHMAIVDTYNDRVQLFNLGSPNTPTLRRTFGAVKAAYR